MPTDEEEFVIAKEKFRRFLTLADEILRLRETTNEHLQFALQAGTINNSLRNSVLVGLFLKALDSFDRLLVDARDKRGECAHHLKTMAESFIYSGWVSADTGETRAKLLCAEGYRSRAVYHEALEELEYAKQWRDLQSQQIKNLEKEWKEFSKTNLANLSVEAKRDEQYLHVYRLACEAAHLGDLMTYMPPQPTKEGLRFSDLSFLRAYVCLKFGIILACDLLHDSSDALKMGMDQQIDSFRERWQAIIALKGIPGTKNEGGKTKGEGSHT